MKKLKPPYSIEVNGEKEVRKVLSKLEKMGYTWCSGHKPTNLETECTKNAKSANYISVIMHRDIEYSKAAIYGNVIKAADFLAEKPETIVIYRKGNETIALDKTTGKKAVAKCSPDDTYDFMTGAQLAFERLTGKAEQQPQEKEFKAYLTHSNGYHYGNIGELTLLRDILGRPLKVGDTVDLYNEENEYRGEYAVVFSKTWGGGNKVFIMGIEGDCKKDGTIDGWKIVKKRAYTEVAHGETVSCIEYVKEEPKEEPKPQLYNGKVVCVD